MKSTINVYEDYSGEVANGYARSSVHVPVNDGGLAMTGFARDWSDKVPTAGRCRRSRPSHGS